MTIETGQLTFDWDVETWVDVVVEWISDATIDNFMSDDREWDEQVIMPFAIDQWE